MGSDAGGVGCAVGICEAGAGTQRKRLTSLRAVTPTKYSTRRAARTAKRGSGQGTRHSPEATSKTEQPARKLHDSARLPERVGGLWFAPTHQARRRTPSAKRRATVLRAIAFVLLPLRLA